MKALLLALSIPLTPLQLTEAPALLNGKSTVISYAKDCRDPIFPHFIVADTDKKRQLLDLQMNGDGITFWGVPGHFKLFNGVSISRFPKVGRLNWRGVTVVPTQGGAFKDLCAFGVVKISPMKVILSFKFQKLGAFGIGIALNRAAIETLTIPRRFLNEH